MVQLHSASDQVQVLDTVIGLTRLSHLQRAIIAGSGGMELYNGLRRRGFMRLATVPTNRMPRRQHAVGLLAGFNSTEIEKALGRISAFLSVNATVAVLFHSDNASSLGSFSVGSSGLGSSGLGVRTRLQQMGFQIEAGVRCHQGLVLSARRQHFGQVERAA